MAVDNPETRAKPRRFLRRVRRGTAFALTLGLLSVAATESAAAAPHRSISPLACPIEVAAFSQALHVTSGISFAQGYGAYKAAMRNLASAYEHTAYLGNAMGAGCLEVVVLEVEAYNDDNNAYRIWTSCRKTNAAQPCTRSSVEATLRASWRRARAETRAADSGLCRLGGDCTQPG
jgi:hypothetical protein